MKFVNDLNAAEVRELLNYDPETGEFTRRIRCGPSPAGAKAGGVVSGYVAISIKNRQYQAHRLAWLYMTGEWPPHEVDHRNGIRSDNRWTNLRAATRAENTFNTAARATSSTGLKGVFFAAHVRRWRARIMVNGKSRNLGYFKTAEEAHAAYCKAAEQIAGEFAFYRADGIRRFEALTQ